MGARLIAIYPILYESRQYKVGEQLPANNHEMTEAWINAGTAKWDGLDEKLQEINDQNKLVEENSKFQQEGISNVDQSIKVQSLGNFDKNNNDEINNKESNVENSEEENTDINKEINSQAIGNIDKKDDEKVDNSESNIDSNEGNNEINEEETSVEEEKSSKLSKK